MTDQSRLQLTDALIERMLARAGRPRRPGRPHPVDRRGDRVDRPARSRAAGRGCRRRGTSRARRARGPSRGRILQVAALAVAAVVVATGAGLFLRQSPAVDRGTVQPAVDRARAVDIGRPVVVAGRRRRPPPGPGAVVDRHREHGRRPRWTTRPRCCPTAGCSWRAADRRPFRPASSAELYDPGSGTWTATGSMVDPRSATRPRCCPTAGCSWRAAACSAAAR